MKKIMILLALVAGTQLANAQKSAEACKTAVTKAQAACDDPKKAEKTATWLNLAKVSMEAYTAPQLNGWIGGSRQELQLLMTGVKVISTTNEVLNGNSYIVDHYATCDYYYNAAEQLQMIIVTTPYVPDALATALYAYENAAKNDPKNTKTKDICLGITRVSESYQTEAVNSYQMGNLEAASDFFQKAADASETAPLSKIDSASIYNAGLTAYMAGKYEKAKAGMERCIAINYYEGGEVFAKLADCQKQLGDTLTCKKTLEEGFAKCPENQGILVGLINLYLDTKDDPEKLFTLLDIAKKNEPSNASLYYVEGNIRKQLGQKEEALAAYAKCAEVNAAYEFGYIGQGLLYFEEAVKYQEEAQNEFNDRKYMALVEKCDEALKNAMPALEKGFEITQEKATKLGLAEYLKNIYFRFRDQAEYQAKYDQYSNFIKDNQ